jgi:hypothetical protein
MKTIALTTAALLTFSAPAMAGSYDVSGSSKDLRLEQDNETQQNNTSSIGNTAVYNMGQAASMRIDDVYCPVPVFMLSGSAVDGGTSAVSGSLVFPLGGRNLESCSKAAEARAKYHAVKAEESVAVTCANLQANGITITDEEKYPELANLCTGVDIN